MGSIELSQIEHLTLEPDKGKPKSELLQKSPATDLYVQEKDYPLPAIDLSLAEPPPARPALSKTRKILLGAVMTNASFFAAAASSSTLLIVPSVSEELQVPVLAAQWVTSSYTLAYGCALLVAGRFADVYGRKQLYLVGLGINTTCTLISGFVRKLIPLCVLRALAGLGQATVMPAAFGIVASSFPGHRERTTAFAFLGVGYPIGTGVGSVFGGLITGAGPRAWQYQFFVLTGIGFIGLVAGYLIVPNVSIRGQSLKGRIDWVGAALIAIALGIFSFSLTQSGLIPNGWKQPYIPALFALSIVLIILFGFWENSMVRRGKEPLVDLALFRRKNWLVMWFLISGMCSYTSIAGWLYMTTIWYQTYKGLSAIDNVVHVIPASILGMAICLVMPYLIPRFRAPVLLFIGALCGSVSCLLFPIQPVGLIYWACEFPSNLLAPFAADFTMSIGSVIISNLAEGHEQSILGAVFQTTVAIAGTLATCLCSLVQVMVVDSTGDLRHALDCGWWMLAGFAWTSCLIIAIFLRRVKLARDVSEL